MVKEDGKTKKWVVLESLGWLTKSSIMPKKNCAIAGVRASSIVELKAQLYQAKKATEITSPDVEYQPGKKKITPHDPLSAKNSGIVAYAL